ncbi:23S rRNA (pseudouridine(1915)-N(3))-methyltransferase RlmH [Helicobacter sp. 11S02596-1]|uniref:23S rRNA (pseudouridine(1915)-N(3))-methyltransferase RlmH n=1 Tax=Helicobacter sp. 11S02596-1 TaxID=1476194 RepID=UPI000BA79927|nr:23S rRNA (pseudouridine(1915)-N(3))-methyltransferase RlmH [Helicobacter sp. 11S02596-1]PAF42347.1 hypothetical protein BJI48_06960 [Helicobacter sp. 11S02596-1]
MKCNLYSITKPSLDSDVFVKHYQKQCKQFGLTLQIYDVMNTQINNAQKVSQKTAQQAYSKALEPFLSDGKNIALHPTGKLLDSLAFSKLFAKENKINFFIGGAYGFEEIFLKKCLPISLSPLTFSHKIVKLILCEQIYRAFSIINHHPYHK